MPPATSPHLAVDSLSARRISEDAPRSIHDFVGVFRVSQKTAYGLDDVSELDQVLFFGSIFERQPTLLPLRPLRERVDTLEERPAVVVGET